MAETFLEALARLREGQAAGATPLPTGYSQIQVPQGTLKDADTRTAPTKEIFRTAGINAPELKDPQTHHLIPEGQRATAQTAALFQQNPNTQVVRYGNDFYGRTVADDVGPDGQPIAAQQVRQGLAEPVDFNHSGTTRFASERTQRFMEQNPPSQDAQARAFFLQRPVERSPAAPAPRLDPKYRTLGEELSAGIARGVDQAQAGGYGALSMLGAIAKNDKNGREPRDLKGNGSRLTLRDRITNWLERTGEKGYMRNTEESQLNPPAYHLKDVQEGKADLLQWALGTLGEALPSTATMALTAAATSGAGALVGGAVGRSAAAPLLRQIATKSAEDLMTTAVRRRLLAMGLTENSAWTPAMIQRAALSVAKDPVKAAMSTYAKRGGFAGAWAGSSALEGGHAYEDAKQALGQANINPWVTAASGGLAGLLDTAAVAYLAAPFAKLFSTPAAEAGLGVLQGASKGEKLLNVVKEVAKGAGLGMLAEGSTEALQEVIGAAATEIQRTDDPRPLTERLMTPDYLQRYLEAGVSGLVFGGVFGVGHGGAHAFNHRQRTAAPAPAAPEAGTGQQDMGAGTQGTDQQEMGAPTREVPPLTGPILNDTGAPVPVDPNAGLSDEDRRRNEQYRRQLEALRQPATDPQTAEAPPAAPALPAELVASTETGPAPGTPDAAESLAAQLAAPPSAPLDPGTVRPASPGPTLNDAGAPVPVDPNAGPTIEDLARRDQFNRQVEAAQTTPVAPESTPAVPGQETSPSPAAPDPTPSPPSEAPTPAPLPGQDTTGRNAALGENIPDTGKGMGSSKAPLGGERQVIVPQAPVTAMEGGDKITSNTPQKALPPVRFSGGHFDPALRKGSPDGDGKDAAMRRDVAKAEGGAIVELISHSKPSSSRTSLNTLGPATPGQRLVLLARNGALRGKALRESTRQAIDAVASHPAFKRFVVGDMPGVDSQFIDYLLEKGYPFTVYSTERLPRPGLVSPKPAPTTGTPSDKVERLRFLPGGQVKIRAGGRDQVVSREVYDRQYKPLLPDVKPTLQDQRRAAPNIATEPKKVAPKLAPSVVKKAEPPFLIVHPTIGKPDTSGMRGPGGRHMLSRGINPGEPGWLGNPHKWAGNGGPKNVTVEDVVMAFEKDFQAKIANDPRFRAAVEGLRGKKVGYYNPNAKIHHLQVVQRYLAGVTPTETVTETAPSETQPSPPVTGEPQPGLPSIRQDGSLGTSAWVINVIRPKLKALQALESATETDTDAVLPYLNPSNHPRDSWITSKKAATYLENHPAVKDLIKRFAATKGFEDFLENPIPGAAGEKRGSDAYIAEIAEAALWHFYPKSAALIDRRAEALRQGQPDLFPDAPSVADLFPRAERPNRSRSPEHAPPSTKVDKHPPTPTPVAVNETAPSEAQPSPPLTSEPQVSTPAIRRGHAQARRITEAWRQLLGLSETPTPALTNEQAQALTTPNTDAHYHAVQVLASQVGTQVLDEHLAKADEGTLAEIQKAWKGALGKDSELPARRAWLSDRIGEVLLHDDKMRRIYADRNLPLVYKWLRTVGQQLLKLVNTVRAKLGFQDPAPPAVVTRFVHALVDQQRTRQAEALGLSPNLTTGLQEATNALLSDAPAKLDALEAAIGKTPHPIYTPWIQALRQVEAAVTSAEVPGLREQASKVLRQALAQIDPAWATADPIARRTLRQRQRDALPSLAGLQAADPKTADAVRATLDAAWTAEDALHRAGSLQRAALDLQDQAGLKLTEKQRITLTELLNATRQERLQDRRLRQAFVGALRGTLAGESAASALARFDALLPAGLATGRSAIRTQFMAKYDRMAPQLAAFEQKLRGRETATLNTMWLALGLAQDEMPSLVPTGKDWAGFGVQYDPANTDLTAELRGGVADYVAQERLFERLPARHRDALAAAYIAKPEGMGINEWLAEHLVRALEGDPILYQTVLLAEATPEGQLGYARHTPHRLLANALTHDGDQAHPAMLDALHHRLNNRYGADAVARAEHVLLGTGDRTNLWYLLAQGIHLVDGELRVDTEARARAQALIRAAGRVEGKQEQSEVEVIREALGEEGFDRLAMVAPEVREGRLPGAQSPARRTPGVRPLLDEATKALNGYYTRLDQLETALEALSPHFEALLETARTLKHDPALTAQQMVRDLLQWRHTLRAARKAAPTAEEALPGMNLADESSPAYADAGVEDEEAWAEKEYLDAVELGAIHDQIDGPDIGSEAEITDALGYENAKEREARPTILRQGLALFTEYTPAIPAKEQRDNYGKARVRHRFAPIKIEDRLDVGTVLNSDNAVSIDTPIAIDSKTGKSEPFTVDPGHELFRQLPAETQAMLFERAQLLGRMGVEAEYRLVRHTTREFTEAMPVDKEATLDRAASTQAGRTVDYLEEQLHLTDSAALYTGTIADGQLVSEQLLLDRIAGLLDKARRDAHKIPKDQRENLVLDFQVQAALDHPLLAQLAGIMERTLPLDALRRLWADNRGWAPGTGKQGRSNIPSELRLALEKAAGDLHVAVREDPGLGPLLEGGQDFTRLLASALGYGHEIFSNRRPPELTEKQKAAGKKLWPKDEAFLHQLDQQPDLPGYQRTVQANSRLEISEEFADRLGIDRDPRVNARMVRLFPHREDKTPITQHLLDFLLRAYLDSYDPRTGTFDAGARTSVTTDALVKVGKNTLTGLEASPDVYYNRIDSLMRGVDLAGRMGAPWAPVVADPHLNPNLILFRRMVKDKGTHPEIRTSAYTAPPGYRYIDRTVADELAEGRDAQAMLERMGGLDQEVQNTIARLERAQVAAQSGEQHLSQQVVSEKGPLWTLRGVLPFEVEQWLDSIQHPSEFDAQPNAPQRTTDRPAAQNPKPQPLGWVWRFTNPRGEGAPIVKHSTLVQGPFADPSKGNVTYTARPLTHLDELIQAQARLAGYRSEISRLRGEAQKILTDKRSLGGSELNQFATFEEEMNDLFTWIDQMEVGSHQARIQTESQLFNPDLGVESKKWDADLRNYQREGHTQLTYKGQDHKAWHVVPGPVGAAENQAPSTFDAQAEADREAATQQKAETMRQAREQKPLYPDFSPGKSQASETPIAFGVDQQWVKRAVKTLGLDTKAMRITFVDLQALQDQQDKVPDLGLARLGLARLGLADIAEQVWAHGAQEPFFTVLKGGQARVILMNGRFVDGKFQRATEEELQDALAHELGHVFFHQRMAAALEKTATRAKLVRLLEGRLPEGYNDLHIEEATAEVVRGWLQGETTPARPGQATLLGKLFKSLQDGLKALLGLHSAKITLDDLLSHAAGRAAEQAEGFRNYSGRQLLADARQHGPQFAKDTWATAKALFDNLVRTAHSWLRNQRNIKGESIESFGLLADILRWTPGKAPRTRTLGGQLFDFTSTGEDSYHQSFEAATGRMFARWGTRIERELHPLTLEEQRQAVADYANGVKSPQARMLARLFQDMGQYFGPVLKRHDPAKALPRIFDQTVLRNRHKDFLTLLQGKMLTPDEAETLYSQLTREPGSDYRADAGQFFAPHFQRARQGDHLDTLSDAELLPYLLVATQPQAALWQYTHQMVKRTEFERRFGGWVKLGENTALNDTRRPTLVTPAEAEQLKTMQPYKFTESGYPLYRIQRVVNGKPQDVKIMWDHTAKFRLLRALAAEQGASHAQLNQLTRVMEAELGRYGADFSPRLRTMQSAMVAGMNWAVLPLSLLSQPTDLALPLLRSNGNFKLAWRGMKLALKAMKEKDRNGLYLAARANGILAGNLREYFSSAYLDTPFLSASAQKMNQTLFRYNGMEYATELVRMFAFAMGHEWIQDLTAKQTAEAEEQLAQLGLDRADVLAWQQAQQRLDDGLSPTSPEVERVQQALNTFVEQSMFRPSASQRPTWASHPAAMLVWYLKSYIWSYADTILARTWREVKRMDGYGQKALMLSLPFLFMLPLAALGLLLRDELRDTLPLPWRAPKQASATEDDSTEYLARLISRTGLFGPMQMLLDAGRASEYGNPYYLSLIGPFATMPDQLIRSVAGASDEHRGRAFTDAILRLAPILGSLPQERRALLDTVY